MERDRTMREGLEQYLNENGFTTDEYTADKVTLSLGPISFPFPNSPARQRAIPLHDLHHVLTGCGTDLIGEAEVGMWELRAGRNTAFLWFINLTAVFIGCFLSPRRVWRAYRAAKGARSLYRSPEAASAYLDRPIVALRRERGLPAEGLADLRVRCLHPRAPPPSAAA
jgi:hypothetical protein